MKKEEKKDKLCQRVSKVIGKGLILVGASIIATAWWFNKDWEDWGH